MTVLKYSNVLKIEAVGFFQTQGMYLHVYKTLQFRLPTSPSKKHNVPVYKNAV
jgi:hypothetical protein